MIMRDKQVRIWKEMVMPVAVYKPGSRREILRGVKKNLRDACSRQRFELPSASLQSVIAA
jgi:hypothetical protein